MVASIRDITSISYVDLEDRPVIPRPQVQAGDILLCIHSCDHGTLSEMGIEGPGWSTAAQRADDRDPFFGDVGGGTKVYRKIATSSEPSSYTLYQDADPDWRADTTVIMIAVRGGDRNNIIIRHTGDSAVPPFGVVDEAVTPSATPPKDMASGLELRVAVAWGPGGQVSWQIPSGYAQRAAVQSREYLATLLVSRTLVTGAPVGQVAFDAGRGLDAAHGLTIIIPSSHVDEKPPDLPSYPDWTPARGSGLYRYTVHDMLTLAYRGDIYPTDVTFDKRIGDAGIFSATLPIPNARAADLAAEVIPREAWNRFLGPGRLVVHIWRAGELWGEYWLTAARIQRSRRGTISIQLRGSTLEAYLAHVPVESDLEYEGDMIANARSLLNNMMGLSGANIGLVPAEGSAGESRPLTVSADDRTTYGDALRAYAEGHPSFEWTITPVMGMTGFERRWEWGAPKIEGTQQHVFTESPHGGDILEWAEEIDALRGGTRVQVRGGTPEVEDASEGARPVVSDWVSASMPRFQGWPRYGQVIDHPGESIVKSQLDGYAQRWMSVFEGSIRVYSCTVALGARPTISPSSLGDQVRRLMVNEWYPRVDGGAGFDQSQRLIGIAITPVSRGSGKEEAQLILEEANIG